MAVQSQVKHAPFGAITAFRFVGALESAAQTVVAWHLARKTEKELFKLTSRQLDDLGITRGDIPNIAARAVK